MDTSNKVIVLADVRTKRAASATLRPDVYEIRTGAGKRPECSVHAFTAAGVLVPPKPA
jgi:hypothetical protein